MGFYWGSVAACVWLAAKSLRASGLSWFLCFLMSCVHASTSPTHNIPMFHCVTIGKLFFPTPKQKTTPSPCAYCIGRSHAFLTSAFYTSTLAPLATATQASFCHSYSVNSIFGTHSALAVYCPSLCSGRLKKGTNFSIFWGKYQLFLCA